MASANANSNNTNTLVPNAPSLLESIESSTSSWQEDLNWLFKNAKESFADVVWEVGSEKEKEEEEVWGHKGSFTCPILDFLSLLCWWLQRSSMHEHPLPSKPDTFSFVHMPLAHHRSQRPHYLLLCLYP